MITLFHRPKTRSSRFIFLLEELGAPYEIKLVNTLTRDGTGAVDPANPHPHGKVPTISDDGEIVFESPAIALYLTDKFPKNGLGPLAGQPGRGTYLSLLAYYTGVLEPAPRDGWRWKKRCRSSSRRSRTAPIFWARNFRRRMFFTELPSRCSARARCCRNPP
jgi:glutathione S-transferase